MKSLRYFLAMFACWISVGITDAQTVHTYFSKDVYPGLYAQVMFGYKHIMLRTQGNYVRFEFLHEQNNILYYSDGNYVAAITTNGSAMSLANANQVVSFSYVAPVTNSSPYSVPSQNRSSDTVPRNKCHFCNGTGKVVKNDHITQYGLSDYETYTTCPECGFRYCSTRTNHYHTTCSKCFGKGYIER